MSARKIKRLEAGGIERQLTPPMPEIKTRAKAGASPKPAAPKRVATVIAADAATGPDSKTPAQG
ncbi:MAG: hypothetical protein ACRED2_08825, partial [Methylocella sp.]